MIRDKNKLKEFLIRTLADPVLIYTTVTMMSMMYHYRDKMTVVFGLISYIIGWVLFRFFDFIKKHNIIGFFAYIAAGIGCLQIAWRFMLLGEENYPISWSLWFFTPVDSVEYNPLFTYSLFTLFIFFMCSVIYYFTRIRYRILMNFLIFIIPFAMYGKEGEKMPTGFIIIMAVGYILMMVCFRPLAENEETTVIAKPVTWASVGIFTLIFAVISTIIPKPEITANREQLETLINADELTDRLVQMLSVFQDTSDGTQFRNTGNNSPVYFAQSEDPMHLKTLSYTTYDFKTDSWAVSEYDSETENKYWSCPAEIYGFGDAVEGIVKAANLSKEFAEKYGLEDFSDYKLQIPERRKIKIYTISRSAEYAPVPQSVKMMSDTSFDGIFESTKSGLFRTNEGKFSTNESFEYEYTPDTFFYNDENRKLVNRIAETDDYLSLLIDASYVLIGYAYDNDVSSEESEYLSKLIHCLSYHGIFIEKIDDFLDYGNDEKIYQLAQEITEGKETEFEKAKALEMYFYNNGFNYDLSYRKSDGENADDFLFDTKTGVCYEYATAMTLLARAVGIPARYCEGFNMTKQYEGEYTQRNEKIDYIVTYQDAHGFPELYIKGYGWMSFEPTITNNTEAEKEETSAVNSLAKAGLYILIFAVLGLFAIIIYPSVYHKIFLAVLKKRSPDDTVKAVIRRICRLYSVGKEKTSHELQVIVINNSGADIAETVRLFDKLVYGGISIDEEEKQKAVEEYISAYEALKETKKQNRKAKHKHA